MRNRTLAAALTLPVLMLVLLVVPASADSHVRIVRLSQVDGSVQIDRNTGQGFEKAFLNLPITQGTKLKTGMDGLAEIEFEDGSALRITPNTVISFPELSLRDSGGKVSAVNLQEGTAYVNFLANKSAKNDELTITFAKETVTISDAAHLRVQVFDTEADVAVFKGAAQISGPSGAVEVVKNRTVAFDLVRNKYEVAKDLEADPFDEWDKQESNYHDRYANNNSYSNNAPYNYGVSDLDYYGSYTNMPGYGLMWQPYFAGAGWDPYMNGAWAYYPGYGYSWVSAYPWGWMPYYYGSWIYVPSYGWGWQPGGSWGGLGGQPRVSGGPAGFVPPKPPAVGSNTVVVSRGGSLPTTHNGFFGSKVTIRPNSAGLGIPRGSLRNLGALSQRVGQQGSVTARMPGATLTSFPGTNAGLLGRPGIARAYGYSPGFARGMAGMSPRTSGGVGRMSSGGARMSGGMGRMSSGGGGHMSGGGGGHSSGGASGHR